MQNSTAGVARLDHGPPKRFGKGALVLVSIYGLLVMLPVLVSIVVVSLVRLGPWSVLLPLAAITFSTFLLPCGFGNPFIRRLVRARCPAAGNSGEGYVVQLTLTPRLRTGIRALLEDADDVGWLSFTGSEVRFQGDAVQLSFPYDQLRELRSRNIGWRGLFLYGPPTTFRVSGLPQVQCFQVAERASSVLPGSRRAARKLFEQLVQCQAAGSS